MAKEKTYPISDDIAEHFDKYLACCDLRDRALKMPFGYKKAKQSAFEAMKNQRLFWFKILKVYPEIKNKAVEYQQHEQAVVIKGPKLLANNKGE